MTYTPKQWLNFHERVLDIWRIFQASPFNGDTGGNWICADSGDSKYATEAERLRVLSAAHSPGYLSGNGNIVDSNNKLKAMGRGTSLQTDTGKQGGA